MALTRAGVSDAFLPDDYASLIVLPVQADSVAFRVSTQHGTDKQSMAFPLVSTDAAAAWTAEGSEITPDDAAFGELVVTPSKVAGLSIVSSELANDSSPSAAEVIGRGLARSIVTKVDAAFVGNTVTNGPSGLGSLTGANEVDMGESTPDAAGFVSGLSAAMTNAETLGTQISALLVSPADAGILRTAPEAEASNVPLLGQDATQDTPMRLLGVPIVTTSALAQGTMYAVPRQHCHVVLRDGTSVETSRDAKFTADQVVIRAIMRVGFGFTLPGAVSTLTYTVA